MSRKESEEGGRRGDRKRERERETCQFSPRFVLLRLSSVVSQHALRTHENSVQNPFRKPPSDLLPNTSISRFQ